MKDERHSAQKSKSFSPSICFCSSVRRYLDWVISNLPAPNRVTRHTLRFVPPVYKAQPSKPNDTSTTSCQIVLTEIQRKKVPLLLPGGPTENESRYHRLDRKPVSSVKNHPISTADTYHDLPVLSQPLLQYLFKRIHNDPHPLRRQREHALVLAQDVGHGCFLRVRDLVCFRRGEERRRGP